MDKTQEAVARLAHAADRFQRHEHGVVTVHVDNLRTVLDALETARRDALEEAARVADHAQSTGVMGAHIVAAAIRGFANYPAPKPAADTGQAVAWLGMETAPRDEQDIILRHKVHGVIQGRFAPGEWSEETPLGPGEYSGPVWVLGDDLGQEEIDETPDDYHDGPVFGWLPLSALCHPAQLDAERVAEDERDRLYEKAWRPVSEGGPGAFMDTDSWIKRQGAMLPADRAALREREGGR